MQDYYEWYVSSIQLFDRTAELLDVIDNAMHQKVEDRALDLERFQNPQVKEMNNFIAKEFEEHLKQSLANANRYYPWLAFRNFIVLCYSILEMSLVNLCNFFDTKWTDGFKGKNKPKLTKSVLFLQEKIQSHDIIVCKEGSISLWNRVDAWREVRNAIVHELGSLAPEKKYVLGVLSLKIDPIDGRVSIGVAECQCMLRDAKLFIDLVYSKLPKK